MFEEVSRCMKSFSTLSSGNSACSWAHDMLAAVFPPLSLAAMTPACEVWVGYSLLALHCAWSIYLQWFHAYFLKNVCISYRKLFKIFNISQNFWEGSHSYGRATRFLHTSSNFWTCCVSIVLCCSDSKLFRTCKHSSLGIVGISFILQVRYK